MPRLFLGFGFAVAVGQWLPLAAVVAGAGTPVSPSVAGPVCCRSRMSPSCLFASHVCTSDHLCADHCCGPRQRVPEPGGATRSKLHYHVKMEVHRQLAYWALLFTVLRSISKRGYGQKHGWLKPPGLNQKTAQVTQANY